MPGAEATGQNADTMQQGHCDTLILLGIEPEADVADPCQTAQSLQQAQVIALSAYRSPMLEQTADIILPIGVYTETSGSFVNLQGDVQSFTGATPPPGEARPGWKVLRVLGNQLNLSGFDYLDSTSVRDAVLSAYTTPLPENKLGSSTTSLSVQYQGDQWQRIGGVPLYASDAIVRRAAPLQATPDAWSDTLRLNQEMLHQQGLTDGEQITLTQDGNQITLAVQQDNRVPDQCVWLPAAIPMAASLGPSFANVRLEKH